MDVYKSALILLVASTLLLRPVTAATAESDAAQSYADALARMRSLPEIPYVRYTLVATSNGVTVDIEKNHSGNVEVTVSTGIGGGSESEPRKWNVTYSSAAHASTVDMADGAQATTHMPLFDPTWYGAHEWISHGLFGKNVTPEANAASPSPGGPPVIASVISIAPSAYAIGDAGNATCSNGSAAHALKLRPLSDPVSHPLRLAVVDVSSGLICALRFDVRGSGGVIGTTGSALINFGDVQGHWLTTDGSEDLQFRVLGFGVKRATIDFRRTAVTFAP